MVIGGLLKNDNMKKYILFIFFTTLYLTSFAQMEKDSISNFYYFSDKDSAFYKPELLRAQKIKHIKEFRKDKDYSDTTMHMADYYFNDYGYLIKVNSYSVYHERSTYEYKLSADNHLLEVGVEKKGKLEKNSENVYTDGLITKFISYYNKDYITRKEFTYNKHKQLTSETNYGPDGSRGTKILFGYDTLHRLISEEYRYPGDTSGYCFVYDFDTINNYEYITYIEKNRVSKSRIEYFSSATKHAEKSYSNQNKLTLIETKKYNKQGLLTAVIDDRSMIKKRRRGKNDFCGYNGPPRYRKTTYKYDSKGNCIEQKDYLSKLFSYSTYKYFYNEHNLLIKKVEYDGIKKDSEYEYTYNK